MSKKVGFIGLGIMGSRMAANLLAAGIDLAVYNRTREKADALIGRGAVWHDTPARLGASVEGVFTMLSDPEAVAQTALGSDGFLTALQPGAFWVDCSTVNPSFSREMAAEAQKGRIRFVDAPVFGSKQPAQEGQLPFFAGGKIEDIEALEPYFNIMGKSVRHVGDAGMGASIKMVLNILLAQNMLIFSEAVALGQALGFTRETLFEIILGGPMAAPYLGLKSKKIEEGVYEPDFPLKWMHKDLHLVGLTAFEAGVPLPSCALAKEIFQEAKQAGLADKDFAVLFDRITAGKRKKQ